MSDKLREAASIWWDRPCYKCRSQTCDMSCEAALAEPAIKESLTVRPWVGLTDDEIEYLMDVYDVASPDYAKAIEAKLKERNNG